jgi:hypothetical protein
MPDYSPLAKGALRDLLIADTAGVVAALSTYEFTTGTATPAVFTSKTLPDDVDFPAIWINERVSQPWDTRDADGANLQIDVQILGEKSGSDKALENLAWRVREILSNASPALNGYTCHGCLASPPQVTTADDDYPSYVVQCRILMTKN